ncbi:MAG TPA: hypothetical protein VH573_18980 [Mycobacteriales bacterium]|jgi:hypothetical protein
MSTTMKVVIGGVGLVAVWLVLAVTLFNGTGSVHPRPDQRPGIVNSVDATGGAVDPTLDPRP